MNRKKTWGYIYLCRRCSCCSYTRNTLSSSIVLSASIVPWPFFFFPFLFFLYNISFAIDDEKNDDEKSFSRNRESFKEVLHPPREDREKKKRIVIVSRTRTRGKFIVARNTLCSSSSKTRIPAEDATLYNSVQRTRCTDGVQLRTRINYITRPNRAAEWCASYTGHANYN